MGLSMTGIFTLLYIKTLREKKISQVKKFKGEIVGKPIITQCAELELQFLFFKLQLGALIHRSVGR